MIKGDSRGQRARKGQRGKKRISKNIREYQRIFGDFYIGISCSAKFEKIDLHIEGNRRNDLKHRITLCDMSSHVSAKFALCISNQKNQYKHKEVGKGKEEKKISKAKFRASLSNRLVELSLHPHLYSICSISSSL